jgi:cysteinyl-tRNA synthetase
MDKGKFGNTDVPAAQKFLQTFDQIFGVLENNDARKLQTLGYGQENSNAGDAEIEKLVAERQLARQTRDFATADRIRKELDKRGIILEDSRDGSVRWKRK